MLHDHPAVLFDPPIAREPQARAPQQRSQSPRTTPGAPPARSPLPFRDRRLDRTSKRGHRARRGDTLEQQDPALIVQHDALRRPSRHASSSQRAGFGTAEVPIPPSDGRAFWAGAPSGHSCGSGPGLGGRCDRAGGDQRRLEVAMALRRPDGLAEWHQQVLCRSNWSGQVRRLRRRRAVQLASAVQPPSTGRATPLMNPLRIGSARNATAAATSSGVANRPMGTCPTMSSSL